MTHKHPRPGHSLADMAKLNRDYPYQGRSTSRPKMMHELGPDERPDPKVYLDHYVDLLNRHPGIGFFMLFTENGEPATANEVRAELGR